MNRHLIIGILFMHLAHASSYAAQARDQYLQGKQLEIKLTSDAWKLFKECAEKLGYSDPFKAILISDETIRNISPKAPGVTRMPKDRFKEVQECFIALRTGAPLAKLMSKLSTKEDIDKHRPELEYMFSIGDEFTKQYMNTSLSFAHACQLTGIFDMQRSLAMTQAEIDAIPYDPCKISKERFDHCKGFLTATLQQERARSWLMQVLDDFKEETGRQRVSWIEWLASKNLDPEYQDAWRHFTQKMQAAQQAQRALDSKSSESRTIYTKDNAREITSFAHDCVLLGIDDIAQSMTLTPLVLENLRPDAHARPELFEDARTRCAQALKKFRSELMEFYLAYQNSLPDQHRASWSQWLRRGTQLAGSSAKPHAVADFGATTSEQRSQHSIMKDNKSGTKTHVHPRDCSGCLHCSLICAHARRAAMKRCKNFTNNADETIEEARPHAPSSRGNTLDEVVSQALVAQEVMSKRIFTDHQ